MNLQTQVSPDVWAAVRTRWENRDYSGAVLDAMYFLSDLIRQKGDLEGDGVSLVGKAFGGSSPRIKVTRLHTETDRNIQSGTEAILRGMYQAVRNPRSHEKVKDSEADACAIIVFLDYMVRVVGEARAVFSEQDFLERVFDPDFVADPRYAELLVEEIPVKKRLLISLEVYRHRGRGEAHNLKLFFQELLGRLQEDELEDFFSDVSDDLRTQDDEEEIKLAVHVIPVNQWERVEEVARLRVENKFIRAIKAGRYNPWKERFESGAFATWGREVLGRSSLVKRAETLLVRKLHSEDLLERAYVVKAFFPWLCDRPKMPSPALERAVKFGLSKGDKDLKVALEGEYLFGEGEWSDDIGEALKDFTPAAPPLNLLEPDDDLPF